MSNTHAVTTENLLVKGKPVLNSFQSAQPEWTNSDHLRRNAMAKSKDVVVTGVSTGIGWGTTKVLVSKGFRVFGSVRKSEGIVLGIGDQITN
jgi:hypothetical protein